MEYLVIITKKGTIKKMEASEVRSMSRTARGVRGITLNDGDEVVSMVSVNG